MTYDDADMPENYIPAIGAAIARAIERFDDPQACGEAITRCFSQALIDDCGIEHAAALIDNEARNSAEAAGLTNQEQGI